MVVTCNSMLSVELQLFVCSLCSSELAMSLTQFTHLYFFFVLVSHPYCFKCNMLGRKSNILDKIHCTVDYLSIVAFLFVQEFDKKYCFGIARVFNEYMYMYVHCMPIMHSAV